MYVQLKECLQEGVDESGKFIYNKRNFGGFYKKQKKNKKTSRSLIIYRVWS